MDTFNKSLPMMLHRSLDAIIPKYRIVFKKHGISEQQWRVLRILWETKTCSTTDLAKKALLPSPSLVGIIDRMISKDLIARERSKTDRRIVNINLTLKGQSLETEIAPAIEAIYQEILSHCDERAWQTMMSTLQTVIDTSQTKG